RPPTSPLFPYTTLFRSYRHELEADIEPFKGLLLGLFFIAVGMSANLQVLVQRPLVVIGIVVVLMAIKGGILFAMFRLQKHPLRRSEEHTSELQSRENLV